MPTQTLAEFILFIAPGFIATYIYFSYFPVKEPSSFTQIAQSTILGLLLIVLLRIIDSTLLNNLLNSNSSEMPSNIFSISIIAIGIVAGYVLVLQLKIRSELAKKVRWLSWLASSPDSIWQQVNMPNVEDWAIVFLDDNSIYLGWISNYRFDPNETEQDFLLQRAKRVDENLRTLYDISGIGVYLNTRNVKRIEFTKGSIQK